MISDITLFASVRKRLSWLTQRQEVLAQNIANADTPNYRPQDLAPVDFSSMLTSEINKGKSGVSAVSVAVTNESHLPNAGSKLNANSNAQKRTYEVAPSGNAVIMEEQLMKAGENAMDYNLMLNVYQKQVSMMRIAIGR